MFCVECDVNVPTAVALFLNLMLSLLLLAFLMMSLLWERCYCYSAFVVVYDVADVVIFVDAAELLLFCVKIAVNDAV